MAKAPARRNAPLFPTIQRNTFNPEPCKFIQLPFVADLKTSPRLKKRCFWVAPEVQSYAAANVIGEQFAADWIQFLKQNPIWIGAGTTGHIAKDMYCPTTTAAPGVASGFWALIEQILMVGAQHVDVYAIAEASAKRLAAYADKEASGVDHEQGA